VPNSNLGQDARHPVVLQGFPQSLYDNINMILELGHKLFLPNLFKFIIYSTVRSYIFWNSKGVPQSITNHTIYIYTHFGLTAATQ